MKMRWLSITLLVALLFGVVALPVNVQAQDSGYTVPISGEAPSLAGGAGLFVGTLRITSFDRQGSTILIKGALDGELLDGGRSTIGNIRREIALPVVSITGGCHAVTLALEALAPEGSEPTLLLSPVALEDRGQPGAAKKLGRLLCELGDLLHQGAPAKSVVKVLNKVLKALS